MEKKTVVLLTYGKTLEHQHADLVNALQNELGILVIQTRGHTQIDMARSFLATLALAHGADVVVFIDHDVLFDPLDVEVLAETARERRAVVGAPYSKRAPGAGIVGKFHPGEVTFGEGGGIYESPGALGMGFTAIHRSVFERLDQNPEYAVRGSADGPIRPYFMKLVVDSIWLHEDASFCHAARAAGAETLIDTRIRVQHIGDYPYQIEDAIPRQPKPSLTLRVGS